MLDLLQKSTEILGRQGVRSLLMVFVSILVMAVFELVGVASVMPFMRIATEPTIIHENEWLSRAYEALGFSSDRQFLIAVGVAVLALFTISNAIGIFTRWLQYRFTWLTAHRLSVTMLQQYVYSPYEYFLSRNSSEMGKQVLAEVNQFVSSLVLPVTEFLARLAVSVTIIALLLYVDPVVALSVIGILGAAYSAIYLTIRKYLVRLGARRLETVRTRFKSANELLGGIKQVLIEGAEAFFLKRFASASLRYSRAQERFMVLNTSPRFIVETLAFGSIIGLVLIFLARGQSLEDAVPMLSLYAVAGYRLLPSVQGLYTSLSRVRYNYPLVDEIYDDLMATRRTASVGSESDEVSFSRAIEFRGVSYSYPGTEDAVLNDIRATIPHASSVAFVGSTGAGKSTLVDILTGLLPPSAGQVLVDEVPITQENVRAWRSSIGYVPQEVFLFDDTVTRNIAFAIKEKDIDTARVATVARIANLHDFVSGLPRGYDTIVGERGTRLSGGQRQRLGLARALYREPSVLVLDEATSALDGITEEAVISGLRTLGYDLTVIMIAHRLTTVRHCDRIFLLQDGEITAHGRFRDLVESNVTFREMARLTS